MVTRHKRPAWTLRAAEAAGGVLRRLARGLPGVVGALLVCAGLTLAWLPLGLMAAGGFLLLVDWRMPDAPARRPTYVDGRDRLRAVS